MKDADTTTRSAGGLISDAMANMSALVRNEVDLARAEINDNASQAGTAMGMIAGAAIIAIVALNLLAAALVAALADAGIEAVWAAVIVGGVLAAIAFVLMNKGANDLKLSSLAPSRTAKNVRRDAASLKETYNEQ